jgi:hypothetical protein
MNGFIVIIRVAPQFQKSKLIVCLRKVLLSPKWERCFLCLGLTILGEGDSKGFFSLRYSIAITVLTTPVANRSVFTIIVLFGSIGCCFSQGIATARWEARIESINQREATVILKANILPGWHLYSQHIADGGPQPTRIQFEADTGFLLVGGIEERGESIKYHDKTYDMDIIWYSRTVEFRQRVLVNDPMANLRGQVSFMTCNTQVCMPSHYYFIVRLPAK